MPSSFFRDDNGAVGGGILRPVFSSSTGIKSATTGAAVDELDISALNVAANRNANSQLVIMVTVQGSNACYFSLDVASQAGTITNASMVILVPNSVNYFVATSADVSVYHQQITGASTLQVAVMK